MIGDLARSPPGSLEDDRGPQRFPRKLWVRKPHNVDIHGTHAQIEFMELWTNRKLLPCRFLPGTLYHKLRSSQVSMARALFNVAIATTEALIFASCLKRTGQIFIEGTTQQHTSSTQNALYMYEHRGRM